MTVMEAQEKTDLSVQMSLLINFSTNFDIFLNCASDEDSMPCNSHTKVVWNEVCKILFSELRDSS